MQSKPSLINSARVIEDQICYDSKDANQIYELCYTRFSLHKRIYNHKTAKAIEHMIVDALLAAEPHLKFSSYINDPKKYLGLTDDIRTEIQRSDAPVSTGITDSSLTEMLLVDLGTLRGTENSRADTESGSLSLR